MIKKQTLKEIFQDDAEILRVLELREQTELLRQIADQRMSFEGIETIKGEKGDTGEAGYAPQKGIDYLTAEEMQAIKDELTPVKGIHYFDGARGEQGRAGEDGQDAKETISEQSIRTLVSDLIKKQPPYPVTFTKKEMKKMLEEYDAVSQENFKKKFDALENMVVLNYGGHGGSGGSGVTPNTFNLSPFLDSVTNVFTIPANTAILQITSSSAPFVFDPDIDYAGSGTTTLTFDAGIDPASELQQGQTILISYY